jgi:mannose-6-phosphate isomerase-like protein (cupin superfamily)
MEPVTGPLSLTSTFLRLGNQGSIQPLAVDQQFWQQLASGQLGDFHHEYLVTTHACEADWPSWEMHPLGDELVCLLSGAVTFILQLTDAERHVELDTAGSFVIVPQGAWHTAKVHSPSVLLFITAGEGTQHRAAST